MSQGQDLIAYLESNCSYALAKFTLLDCLDELDYLLVLVHIRQALAQSKLFLNVYYLWST